MSHFHIGKSGHGLKRMRDVYTKAWLQILLTSIVLADSSPPFLVKVTVTVTGSRLVADVSEG